MAPSPSPTATPSRTINYTSHGSPTPSVTSAPSPDLSIHQQQLYYAYAVPVEGGYEGFQAIQNKVLSSTSKQFERFTDGGGDNEAIEDNKPTREGKSWKGKEREWVNRNGEGTGSKLMKRGSRRRRGLPLGLVSDMEDARRSLEKRLPMAEGYPSCNLVGNGVLSCYPESDTAIVQGEYSKFIWNANFPTFIGAGDVDIYLYNANTEDIATSWRGVQNARGMIGIVPDEEWWPEQSASEWFNRESNVTIPYFFVIVDGGDELTGGETHQSTFTVIQTAAPTSLSSTLALLTASSLSSVSSISSLSAASASSLSSLLSNSLNPSSSSSGTGTSSSSSSRSTNAAGELQPSSDASSGPAIPKWAIAIIVILGFFLLVGALLAIYFIRRRRTAAAAASGVMEEREREGEDGISQGSREPMLGTGSGSRGGGGIIAPAVIGGGAGGAALGALAVGAGKKSDEEKEEEEERERGLDRNDAARMAEAFRAALRRPEFPHNGGTESSGESQALTGGTNLEGGGTSGGEGEGEGEDPGRGRELIEEELRSEGKSMRDVEGGGGKRWG